MNAPRQYLDYVRFLKNINLDEFCPHLHQQSENALVQTSKMLFNRAMEASYVLDYTEGRYLYVSDRLGRLFDYPATHFLDGKLEFTIGLCHPDDLKIFNESIFPNILKFFGELPANSCNDYLISFNFRAKNRRGSFINILQQSVVTHMGTNNLPLITAGFLTNISAWVTDSRIVHTIEPIRCDEGQQNCHSLRNVWFTKSEDRSLSSRETEILRLVCEGFDSRQISDRLSISWHTVNNHRRNILRKTGSLSFPGLMKYAVQSGLL